ncbi:MAG: hypothetical protein B7X41_19250 [Microbacterium sp. 14-71-5]|nr:MAG: hypothetical protein B7X41_19250 [Microbacterium sp. 14-71-5]
MVGPGGPPTVTINTIPMYGVNQHADDVIQVDGQFFQDWYSLSESKTDIRERPAKDGAFGIDRDYRTALPLTLNGRVRGTSWPTQLASLRAGLGRGQTVTVTVTDHLGISNRSVSIRRFTPVPNPGVNLLTFEVIMAALDPFMYGTTQSVTVGVPTAGTGQPWPQVWPAPWGTPGNSGRATAANTGSQPTPMTLSVAGGLDAGVELVEINTGSRLLLNRPIPVGSNAVFDASIGRVYLDTPTNDISGFLTRRDWTGFQIPGNGSSVVQFNPLGAQTGTPTLTVSWAPRN